MKPQIISREEIIEDEGEQEQVTRWYFSKDRINEINLENLIEDKVIDCEWLDARKTTLLVNYSDWDSNELYALVSLDGELLRKGISWIEKYLEEQEVMIAMLTGWGLGMQNLYYGMQEDDRKIVVLDRWGKLIVTPEYDTIDYIVEENCFVATTKYGDEKCFYPNGEEMERKAKRTLRKLRSLFKKRKTLKSPWLG